VRSRASGPTTACFPCAARKRSRASPAASNLILLNAGEEETTVAQGLGHRRFHVGQAGQPADGGWLLVLEGHDLGAEQLHQERVAPREVQHLLAGVGNLCRSPMLAGVVCLHSVTYFLLNSQRLLRVARAAPETLLCTFFVVFDLWYAGDRYILLRLHHQIGFSTATDTPAIRTRLLNSCKLNSCA
jgi:hypothetical protein